jgi:hypothetical protein
MRDTRGGPECARRQRALPIHQGKKLAYFTT